MKQELCDKCGKVSDYAGQYGHVALDAPAAHRHINHINMDRTIDICPNCYEALAILIEGFING